MDNPSPPTDFSLVLAALRDLNTPFPVRFLRSFSDLSRSQVKALIEAWPAIPDKRKVNLLEDLDNVLEKDTLVNFENLAVAILPDENSLVRVLALRLLWECENPDILPMVISLSRNDADEAVRSTSTNLLGKFILMGELETISGELNELLTQHLLSIIISRDTPRVKQQALESLGYSSHPDVPELIRNAYASNDNSWVTSALCAMGRSADEQWAAQVEESLSSPIPDIQMEAIKAAGDLELENTKESLLSMLDSPSVDVDIRMALVWSLSQIGGDDVREKFDQLLEEVVDEDEIDWIEHALENLEISSSSGLEILDFSPDEILEQRRNRIEDDDEDVYDDEFDDIDLDDEIDLDEESEED
jgi:HEAT repeat protein